MMRDAKGAATDAKETATDTKGAATTMSETKREPAGRAFKIVDRRLDGALGRAAEHAAAVVCTVLEESQLEPIDRQEAERGLQAIVQASSYLRSETTAEPAAAGWLQTLARAPHADLLQIEESLRSLAREDEQAAPAAASALDMLEMLQADRREQRRLDLI
jgi:hypothetical protein